MGKNLKKFYNLIRKGNYGQSGLNEKYSRILPNQVSLYKKWYGNCSFMKYKEILISQAAEYATMGFLIKKQKIH